MSSVCQNCFTTYEKVFEVMVHYVSLEEIISKNLTPDQWPRLLEQFSATTECPQCHGFSSINNNHIHSSVILFVEISLGLISVANFVQYITIGGIEYTLVSLVRHLGNHFSCAVNVSDWVTFDDLSDVSTSFENLNKLYLHHRNGWFFGVYIKSSKLSKPSFQNSLHDHDYATRYISDQSCEKTKNFKSEKISNSNENSHLKSQSKTPDKVNKRQLKLPDKIRKRRKKTVMHGFPTPLVQESKAIEEMTDFHNSLKMTMRQWDTCYEAWPVRDTSCKSIDSYTCTRCIRDCKKI